MDHKPSQVIVGSSMSTRMKFEAADDIFNLAFGGGGPLSGLEIIRRSGYVPRAIYIESNVFTMEADESFLDKLFAPILFGLRGRIIAFQEKYQLLTLAGNFIYRFAGRSREEKLNQKVDEVLRDKSVHNILRSLDTFEIDNRDTLLRKWHRNIAYFSEKGTKLLFFEMPNDSRLTQTVSRSSLRSLIRQEFPGIPFVKSDNLDDRYKTTDGIHLTPGSATAFSEYFRTQIILK
jgi:hypothetical protein